MSSSLDGLQEAIAKFKQDVFAKLTLLGMPYGEAAALRHLWKLINLCTKVCTCSNLEQQRGIRQILKALYKDLGTQRADEFINWLKDLISSDFAKFQKTHVSKPNASPASETIMPQVEAISFLRSEGRRHHHDQDNHDQIGNMFTKTSATPATLVMAEGSGTTRESALADSVQGVASQFAVSAEIESADAPAALVFDEAFVEVKSKDGRIYYWDRRAKDAVWTLPVGIRARWASYRTPTGRTYYSDRSDSSRETMWSLPSLELPQQAMKEAKQTQADDSISMQPSEAALFWPELGLLKPVVLPVAPSLSEDSHDLGPFEAVLKPETPVLTSCRSPKVVDLFELKPMERADSVSHETEYHNFAEPPSSSDTSQSVTVKPDSTITAKLHLDKQHELEMEKKDLQIKLLNCKLEIMSADTSSLREELASLKKQLDTRLEELGEKSGSNSQLEHTVVADLEQKLTPLRRKVSAGRSARRPNGTGSKRSCDANSDAESESSVASDVTQLSSDSEEDDKFYRVRFGSQQRRRASDKDARTIGTKRKIESATVFERASKRRSSLGGA